MAGVLQHLRSSTLDKRPNPASMVDGQVAINYASGSPGMFFKDSNGDLVKVGPVHVGATAPNISPASGGTAGNSKGEQWLDTSGGTYVFKIWDGSAWRSEAGEFVNAAGDTMTGSLTMGVSANIIFEGSVDDGFETTLTVANPTADRTITLPNVTGTVVTTGDSGSVTSTMIADGTIVNADVNASAAIAGTKISPDFGSQNVITTGTSTAASFIPTSSTVPTNGVYLPAANSVALSTNGTGRLFVGSTGNTEIISAGSVPLQVSASFPRIRSNDSDGTNLTADFYTSNGTAIIDSRNDTVNGAIVLRGLGGGVASEYMRITSAGLVGIGTSSPRAATHITSTSAGAGSIALRLENDSATAGTETILQFAANTSNSTVRGAQISGLLESTNGTNLLFYTNPNGASPLERCRITSAGRLGLGTTASISPNAPLDDFHIASTDPAVLLEETDAGTDEKFWRIRAEGSILRFEGVNDAFNATTAWLNVTRSTGARAVDNIAFNTGTTERLRITSDGKLGLGISSPNERFSVEVNGSTNRAIEIYNGDTVLADGELVHAIRFTQNDASFPNTTHASIETVTTGSTGLLNMVFKARDNTEYMRIDAQGRVGIGTTAPSGKLTINETDTSAGTSYEILRLETASGGLIQLGVDDKTSATPNWRINTGTNESLIYAQGGLERARIDSSGRLLVGTSTDSGGALLQVNGDRVRIATAKTPASATAAGVAGEICWDASYVYVCVAANTWKRSAIATW